MKQTLFSIIFLVSLCKSACSQISNADSVELVSTPFLDLPSLSNLKEDTLKLKLFLNTAFAIRKKDPKTAFEYAKKANLFAQSILKNENSKHKDVRVINLIKSKLALSYNYLGGMSKNLNKYDESIAYLNHSITLYAELADKKGTANAMNNLGNTLMYQSRYVDAISAFLQTLKIREALKDSAGIIVVLGNLGLTYYYLKNYDEGIKYINQSIVLANWLNDKQSLGNGYGNLGIIYQDLKKDSMALEYNLKSLKIKEEIDDKIGIANSIGNIGNIFFELKKNKEAKEYSARAILLHRELEHYSGVATSQVTLANCLLEENNFTQAIESFKEASLILDSIKERDGLFLTYLSLAKAYQKSEDFNNAYHYQSLAYEIKDSILSEKNNKAVAELQTKYETEKKDREIELLSKDREIQELGLLRQKSELDKALLLNERQTQELSIKDLTLEKTTLDLQGKEQEKQLQRLQLQRAAEQQKEQDIAHEGELSSQRLIRNIIISGIAILCMIGYLLFNRYQLGKKIESQQAIINERVRISRELHDDVGAQLSTAKMFLSDLKKNFNHEKGKELIDSSLGLLETSIKDLRVVMDELRQSTLKDKGYIAATEELVKQINQQHGIYFMMSHHGISERLPPETEHHLYRITQELINNTLKYANAKNVTIDLVKQADKLVLTYDDDGSGFDMSKAKRGYGLGNIESRIKSMDGNVELNTAPGKGFLAVIEIPLIHDNKTA